MRTRRTPRGVGQAVEALAAHLAPQSLLADVQRVWPQVAGPALSTRARPAAARAGVVTLHCESAVWAHELTLMAPQLAARLQAALGPDRVAEVRCVARPAATRTPPSR